MAVPHHLSEEGDHFGSGTNVRPPTYPILHGTGSALELGSDIADLGHVMLSIEVGVTPFEHFGLDGVACGDVYFDGGKGFSPSSVGSSNRIEMGEAVDVCP